MRLLIDGKNLVYRAFYGMPELTRASDGFPTGAIYGWMKALWRLTDEYPQAASVEVFWDAGLSQRQEVDADYKAQRKPMPEPMRPQLPVIERLTNLCGVASWKLQGSEADDLIASRALACAAAGEEVVIVSADKDFAQLVNEKISILNPPPTANPKEAWRKLDRAGVVEKFGVAPEQIADYLALMGDNADNVAGIEGVGPKTASEWLRTYKNIDGIIANCGKLNPKRFQNIIYENQEKLRKNQSLTTLTQKPLPEEIKTQGALDAAKLIEELTALEMKSTTTEAQKRYGVAV